MNLNHGKSMLFLLLMSTALVVGIAMAAEPGATTATQVRDRWAQINYPYGANLDDSRHKLEYDLYYAKNYTPFLDLLILLQTLRVVLWHEGAR